MELILSRILVLFVVASLCESLGLLSLFIILMSNVQLLLRTVNCVSFLVVCFVSISSNAGKWIRVSQTQTSELIGQIMLMWRVWEVWCVNQFNTDALLFISLFFIWVKMFCYVWKCKRVFFMCLHLYFCSFLVTLFIYYVLICAEEKWMQSQDKRKWEGVPIFDIFLVRVYVTVQTPVATRGQTLFFTVQLHRAVDGLTSWTRDGRALGFYRYI